MVVVMDLKMHEAEDILNKALQKSVSQIGDSLDKEESVMSETILSTQDETPR